MKQFILIVAGAAVLFSAGANAQTFRPCSGEYWEPWKGGQCPTSEAYAYCYDAEHVAARICHDKGSTGKPLMVKMRDTPGHKCGYAEFDVVNRRGVPTPIGEPSY